MATATLDHTRVLAAIADPLRWRIVQLLAGEQLCVCHLVDELDAPQPLVSHHLKVLREAAVVRGERFRYWTYYSLEPAVLAAVAAELAAVAAQEVPPDRRPCC